MTFDLESVLPSFNDLSQESADLPLSLPPLPPMPQKKEVQVGDQRVNVGSIPSLQISHLPPPQDNSDLNVPNISNVTENFELLKKEVLKGCSSDNPNSPEGVRALALLKQNFNPAARIDFFTCCLEKGWDRFAEAMIDEGIISEDDADNEGATPLHLAALHGKIPILEKLLPTAFDVDEEAQNGLTALHLACVQGHTDAALLLIEHGADINAKNALGNTPIGWVLRENQHDLLKAVLAKAKEKNLTVVLDSFFARYTRLSKEEREAFEQLGSFKEVIKMKRGGQVWGFEGFFKVGLLQAKYEAHSDSSLLPQLYRAQRTFIEEVPQENPCSSLAADLEEVQNSKDLTPEQLAAKVRKGERVMIPAGWTAHTTFLVFSGNRVYKCNRGEESGEKPGIVIYETTNKTCLEEIFKKIYDNKDALEGKVVFNSEIDTALGLVEVSYIPQKDQKIGNCVKASCNSAFFALLLDTALKSHSFPQALQIARKVYKEYTFRLRVSILNEQMSLPRPNVGFLKEAYEVLKNPLRLIAVSIADKIALMQELVSACPQIIPTS